MDKHDAPMTVRDAAEAIGVLGNAQPEHEDVTPEEDHEDVYEDAEAADTDDYEAEPEGDAEDDEVEATEAEPDGDDTEEEQRFIVKVDGEEMEVSLDELTSGYQMQADYTRKTQELAEHRKEVESAKAELAQKRQAQDEQLQLLEQALYGRAPDPAEMMRLAQEDPDEYIRRQAVEQQRQANLNHVQQERAKIKAEQTERLKAHIQTEQAKLVQAVPELGTPDGVEKLRGFLVDVGYTDEEIGQAYDHRALVTAWKAYQYDQMANKTATKAKQVKPVPKVTKKGKGPQDKASRQAVERQRKVAQLKKTGSLKDAAAILAEQFK